MFPIILSGLGHTSKIALSPGISGINVPPNTWFLGPVNIPNSISIGSAVFLGLTVVSNTHARTQTTHTRNISNNREDFHGNLQTCIKYSTNKYQNQ